MSARANWAASVDDLIRLFGDAIRALVPIVERAHMAWKAPDSYDDWDRICEAVYRSTVIGSIEFAEEMGTSLFALLDHNSNVLGHRRVATADVKFNLSYRDRNSGTLGVIDKLTVSL